MNAVAKTAGVATGTAYVHYQSKDDLVIATYLEIKAELADAVLSEHDPGAGIQEQYRHVFRATYAHMRAVPERAKFLAQLEGSPYRVEAHRMLAERGDRLIAMLVPLLEEHLVSLPPEVIWAMSLGLVIQLVASGISLATEELDVLVDATWRSITA